ncbi:DUF72 domain-containing protein [Kutzneria buriramensis]|uniref:Uncharacterized protein YecE (DUF72 family) n=1 Tax=Kutzneria buriramensis TaxID=1045776 RepID=A0A3E0HZC2_9PSEU|nr:DUF72 domain-containing protein [Kutzneria buriramensis]REH51828.1 uncharacterized protein YecE (DUF72 family) [Kutzneria buriramensis]
MIRIGTSGWKYPEWRGDFYPRGLVQRRELEFLAGRVDTIEINGTFYSLRRPEHFRSWAAQTPPDFVFAVKGIREVTHVRRLRGVEESLRRFFESGVRELGPRLGPILWQLPSRSAFDPTATADFLALLDPSMRHALEVRHESFRCDDFFALARRHNVAVVYSDGGGRWPLFDVTTADFSYIRLHGAEELYISGYSDHELAAWADRVADLDDVFVYFDNTMRGRAPRDAMTLAALVRDRRRRRKMRP